ncbi:neuferricin precursor [Danio rerio]|uniref:Neuferricin n=1 Tax=Danio rerio TaxID=7955 RepID=NEUFC_DANRE|nr:neuferricin precursor [Danio rerio]A2CES0.1 RecName: Full=Neuferricin; AltName: Full=Cytochrome b5 domain-containing protein 2; Flags: Precursor [Danio rerio]|eukprot:NP_001096144.1 neuferricin precursor [Danio rerio]
MLKYLVALISMVLAVWTVPEWLTFPIYGNVVTVLESWLRQRVSEVSASSPGLLLTKEQLSLYNGGKNSKGLYLAILGQVFDVEKGRKHYGPGGGYHFFTGKDASRAFITGDFTEAGLSNDVSDFSESQIVALYDWLSFYQRDYTPVGKLIGRFYTETGQPTDALLHVEAFLSDGLKKKAQAQSEMQLYPSCNSEWSEASGGRVWCSTMSGGIHRDWVGVPRMLFTPGSGHSRCVCIRLSDPVHSENRNLREYTDCPPRAESCQIAKD